MITNLDDPRDENLSGSVDTLAVDALTSNQTSKLPRELFWNPKNQFEDQKLVRCLAKIVLSFVQEDEANDAEEQARQVEAERTSRNADENELQATAPQVPISVKSRRRFKNRGARRKKERIIEKEAPNQLAEPPLLRRASRSSFLMRLPRTPFSS
jgi:hypothetical protein